MKNKLDEIIENTDYTDNHSPVIFAKQIALEFAKHILEEAANNAKQVPDNDLSVDYPTFYIDRKSITEVLNKYL